VGLVVCGGSKQGAECYAKSADDEYWSYPERDDEKCPAPNYDEQHTQPAEHQCSKGKDTHAATKRVPAGGANHEHHNPKKQHRILLIKRSKISALFDE
jgi:hypothetical protein